MINHLRRSEWDELPLDQLYFKWRVDRGIGNGRFRVKAKVIYEDFQNWAKDKITKVPSLMKFFIDFKKTIQVRHRYKNGVHYMLSKSL